jgi:hypothetical protein
MDKKELVDAVIEMIKQDTAAGDLDNVDSDKLAGKTDGSRHNACAMSDAAIAKQDLR